jgi:hypothetical protein
MERLDDEQLAARCKLLHTDAEAVVVDLAPEHQELAREQAHASLLPLEARLSAAARAPTLERLRASLNGAQPPEDWYLITAATWVRPLLPADERAVLYPAWSRTLRRAATLERAGALDSLQGIMRSVPAMGGPAATTDAAEAILDVRRRWP